MSKEKEDNETVADLDKAYDAIKKEMAEDGDFKKELFEQFKGELKQEGLTPSSDNQKDYEPGEKFKKALGPMAYAAKNRGNVAKIMDEDGVDGEVKSYFEKDTTYSDASNAGVTIPTPLASDIIPVLESDAVFLDEGQPDIVSMPEGKMEMGRLNQRPTSYWKGETEAYTEGNHDFDLLTLDAQKLTTLVEASNEYLDRGVRADSSYLFDQMERSAANELDATFLESLGGSHKPQGILGQVTGSHVNGSSGSSISDIVEDGRQAKRLLAGADVPQGNLRWFMRPEVKEDLMFDINSAEDTMIFREEVANGRFMGVPFSTTTNIDLDGSNNSNIYLVAMDEVLVGRTTNLRLESSRHEKFSNDITVLKLAMEYDMKLKHEEAAAVIEDYTLQ